ncbi:hypothetical protein [Deinococcus ruber]|uniref:Lipoprotein n=1 Tax=Deinococcus ruber TaxID=1848197 RepID=A0A918KWW9_9DEIO|nr:hypothetical protein [Deinococcus ruber]GGR38416.1 hypothetical protein GCM10008957_54430 [Deinococcus ruber]
MRHTRQATLLIAVLLGLGTSRAAASANPLVGGQWSYTSYRSDGQASYSMFFVFQANGRFDMRIVNTGLTSDYTGTYRLSANLQAIQMVYQDYSPRQDCNQGFCYPIPPLVQLGAPLIDSLNIISASRFELMDASGPMLFVRGR